MENNGNNHNGAQTNYNHNGSLDDAELKFGKMYHVIDALVDTVNIPQNRKNAIKFAIRAVGELLSEFPHQQNEKQQPSATPVSEEDGTSKIRPKCTCV